MESRWDLPFVREDGSLPETIVSPIDGAEMVLVPGGPFLMGSSEEDIGQWRRPDITIMTARMPWFLSDPWNHLPILTI